MKIDKFDNSNIPNNRNGFKGVVAAKVFKPGRLFEELCVQTETINLNGSSLILRIEAMEQDILYPFKPRKILDTTSQSYLYSLANQDSFYFGENTARGGIAKIFPMRGVLVLMNNTHLNAAVRQLTGSSGYEILEKSGVESNFGLIKAHKGLIELAKLLGLYPTDLRGIGMRSAAERTANIMENNNLSPEFLNAVRQANINLRV